MMDILDAMMGLDKKNEIFNLWYEVTYLRMVISEMMDSEIAANINFEKIKLDAQKVVKERFPLIEINFNPPTPEQAEAKRKHIEDLKILRDTMTKVTGESEQECPCCTHPDSSESPDVSPPPSSEA